MPYGCISAPGVEIEDEEGRAPGTGGPICAEGICVPVGT